MSVQRAPALGVRVSALLLAAGAASRMGHRPKGLLEMEGVALVRRAVNALTELGVCEVGVVLGHHAPALQARLLTSSARCLIHPRPQEGQISSLRLGLRSVGADAQAVMVLLCDQPLVGAAQLRALIQAYEQRPMGTQIVQPHVQGLPGNPVLMSQAVRQQILAAGPEYGCRQWQAAHPEQVHAWPTTDRAYRIDVDTLEDIDALAVSEGCRLRWPDEDRGLD
ncbi:MAG: NTP transferase domain-containing protein [Betaproteobacteria bacterium]